MNRVTFPFLLSILFLLSLPGATPMAQESIRRAGHLIDSAYYARRTAEPVRVDGLLDERCWTVAQRAGNFVQNFPNDTLFASSPTEVMVSYDDRFLYVAARVYHSDSGQRFVIPSLKRDFRGEANDALVVSLDPFMDRLNAFSFGMSPFGVQREGLIVNGGVANEDLSLSWDNKWYGQSVIHADHWSTEMAIPWSTLRFRNGSDRWLVNFYHIDSHNAERSGWSRVPNQYGMISLAFTRPLVFETPLRKKGPNLSLIPYVSSSAVRRPVKPGPGNSDFTTRTGGAFGGDMKVGLGPSLNADITFNPDFSQVEVDNQVTNLDRFEILFPEKRQFFLENGDLFANFGVEGIRPFFSRRIGVTRDPGTGQNIQNKIDAGLRISGKLGDKTRVGLLQMRAAAVDSIGQPAQDFTVVALQRKLFARSGLGFIFTNKEEAGRADFNRVAGVDYIIGSRNNAWNGKIFSMMSFDPVRTRRDMASGALITFNRREVELRQRFYRIGEEFNPEVGFLRRRGYSRVTGDVWWKFYPGAASRINRHGPMFDYDVTVFPDLGVTDYDLNLLYNVQWRNYATLRMRFRRDFTRLTDDFDPTNTGGAKLLAGSSYVYYSMIGMLMTDQRKRLAGILQWRSGGYFNGTRHGIEGELGWRFQPFGSIGSVFTYNRLRFPQPYRSLDLVLLGPKLDVTLSRSVFFSALAQYNNQIRNVNLNLRFQWRFAPVSDLFIVYTDNYYSEGFNSKGGALVLKATYWLNM
jgi:hypothetical protein